ncbi:hypothetical protein [Fibrella forsythiae]|uniref:Uncharacterized protein n=1 Tax=Fibrella forsythiae TaxID=2817061 RepID=A0ABS3JE81_9BACT|nr:hypothetical protein [Fibrella forsythiae]MBO0948312.1 hypothetical protein [Fibrella forsythiae]
MNAIRQIVSPLNGRISIDIPEEYRQKSFEVIILPIDDTSDKEQIQAKMARFLQTLPLTEPDLTDADILAEIKEVRAKRYK